VKFEDGLPLDHHPCDPGISYGQQEEKADHGIGAEAQELNAEGEREEDASCKDVDGPLKTHPHSSSLLVMEKAS